MRPLYRAARASHRMRTPSTHPARRAIAGDPANYRMLTVEYARQRIRAGLRRTYSDNPSPPQHNVPTTSYRMYFASVS